MSEVRRKSEEMILVLAAVGKSISIAAERIENIYNIYKF